MRAITVKQPWAWAIIHAGKDVENRTRNIAASYRGPLLIHAGLTEDISAWSNQLIRAAIPRMGRPALPGHGGATVGLGLHYGAIIGVVDLINAHRSNHGHRLVDGCCKSAWAEQWADAHLVLANPRPLSRPVYCRGALGLWRPSPDVAAKATQLIRRETRA